MVNNLIVTAGRLQFLAAPEDPGFECQGALYFLDGHYLFRHRDKNGVHSKFVTAADVAAAFSQSELDSGWLPAGIVRAGHNAKGDWFVYSAPAQKMEILLGEDAMAIPIPRTVLVGIGNVYYIWAMGSKYFDQSQAIYHAPFPNVYSDGKICWGQNTPPRWDMAKARGVWELFFKSPFNADLTNGKSHAHQDDVRETLKALVGKRAYPGGDLVRIHSSAGGLIETMLRGR